jgi:phage repressor protein C with HTH and peptisase S24 domain
VLLVALPDLSLEPPPLLRPRVLALLQLALEDLLEARYPLLREVAERYGHPRAKLAAVRLRGPSMDPEIRDGQFVIVERRSEPIEGVCVLEWRGELMVKRLERNFETGGYKLRSNNPPGSFQEVGPDTIGTDIRVTGYVRDTH